MIFVYLSPGRRSEVRRDPERRFLIVLLLGGAKGGVGRWLHHLTHRELRSDGGGEQRRVDGKAGLDVVAKPRLKRGKL